MPRKGIGTPRQTRRRTRFPTADLSWCDLRAVGSATRRCTPWSRPTTSWDLLNPSAQKGSCEQSPQVLFRSREKLPVRFLSKKACQGIPDENVKEFRGVARAEDADGRKEAREPPSQLL